MDENIYHLINEISCLCVYVKLVIGERFRHDLEKQMIWRL